jgi:hypothetical protein
MTRNGIATVPAWQSVEFLMTLANAGELTRRAAQMSVNAYFDRIEQERRAQFPETTDGSKWDLGESHEQSHP